VSLYWVNRYSEATLILELEITLQAAKSLMDETPFTLSFNRDDISPRKEIFSGTRNIFSVRWSPRMGEIPLEVREAGVIELPISVLLSYREGDSLISTSKAADVRIKLDTTRLRIRLDSKLDLLMGKIPKELKS